MKKWTLLSYFSYSGKHTVQNNDVYWSNWQPSHSADTVTQLRGLAYSQSYFTAQKHDNFCLSK